MKIFFSTINGFVSLVSFSASVIQILGFLGILPQRLEVLQLDKDEITAQTSLADIRQAIFFIAILFWISFLCWTTAVTLAVNNKHNQGTLKNQSPAMAKLSLVFPVWFMCLLFWFLGTSEILNRTHLLTSPEELLLLGVITLAVGLPVGFYSMNFIHSCISIFERRH